MTDEDYSPTSRTRRETERTVYDIAGKNVNIPSLCLVSSNLNINIDCLDDFRARAHIPRMLDSLSNNAAQYSCS